MSEQEFDQLDSDASQELYTWANATPDVRGGVNMCSRGSSAHTTAMPCVRREACVGIVRTSCWIVVMVACIVLALGTYFLSPVHDSCVWSVGIPLGGLVS
mmetsp:Transcript_5297/g.13004  ORF Transcript_5297/g.13004 Transcript_5297/m.13004 type:complete len:100 (+) Transcript_5297:1534-1833(+)